MPPRPVSYTHLDVYKRQLNHLTGKYLSLCSTVRTHFDPEDLLMDFGDHWRHGESNALRNQYDFEILLERPLPVLRMK